MSNTVQKFFFDENFAEKEIKTTEITESIKNIVEIYHILSIEERIQCKKIIRELDIFLAQ